MATKRVYISGPITGTDGYYKKFLNAEIHLRGQGYDIINPAEITSSMPKDLPWDAYMDMTLPLLKYCDAIYSLKGWQQSTGARMEREYAIRIGLKIMEGHTDGD